MGPARLFYDEDCGFCRFAAERVRTWHLAGHLAGDRGDRLVLAPIQSPCGDRWLETLGPEARFTSWHLVTPDGQIWSAGAAVPELLRRLPLGSLPAAILARLPRTTDRAYACVARHRAGLGRLVGREACVLDPSRRGDRSGARTDA